jgi:hypothetical protein
MADNNPINVPKSCALDWSVAPYSLLVVFIPRPVQNGSSLGWMRRIDSVLVSQGVALAHHF